MKDNLDSQNIFYEMSYDDCKQMSIELTGNISNYLEINYKHIDDYFSRECFYSIEVEKTDKNLKDILNDDKYRIRNQDGYIKYLEKELWK